MGKERDNITAKWARDTVKEVLGIAALKELNELLDGIEVAVSRNKDNLYVKSAISNIVAAEINKRGFKIERHEGFGQRDPAYYTINW